MRITSKGQVTIPLEYRNSFGFLSDTEVEFVPSRQGLLLKKSKKSKRRGKGLIEHLKGSSTSHLTTEEIMRLTRADHD